MYKKKSGFLTFIFSLLPGAGHMYLGLMKNGLSLMGIFFFVGFLSKWLNIEALAFVMPVIWFYSFFDCWNKFGMSEEERTAYIDEYLFSIDSILKIDNNIIKRRSVLIGGILLLFGAYLLLENAVDVLRTFCSIDILRPIREVINYIPKVLVSFLIIGLGIHLISGKKKESENDD